jgi:hypothetical protein
LRKKLAAKKKLEGGGGCTTTTTTTTTNRKQHRSFPSKPVGLMSDYYTTTSECEEDWNHLESRSRSAEPLPRRQTTKKIARNNWEHQPRGIILL